MLCDKYEEALIEAVGNGAALPIRLREHVETCAHCGATLAAQQALVTALDLNMRRTANVEVPDSFLRGIRSCLTEERTSRRSSSPAWVAIAASAALIFLTVMATRDRHAGAVLDVKQASPASGALPHPKEAVFSKDLPKVSFARTRGERSEPRGSQGMGDPRPLIPTGHQEAIDQVIGGVARGQINGEVLLTDAHLTEVEDLQIPRIAIAGIAETSPQDAKSGSSDTPEVRTLEISIDAGRRTK
jgi:hypothetical protein